MFRNMVITGAVFGLSILINGCSTPVDSESVTTPEAKPNPFSEVHKGMSTDELSDLLGNPASITPIEDARVENGFVWTYRDYSTIPGGFTFADVEETPYIDPITGEDKVLLIPVPSQEIQEIYRRYHFYIIDGSVVGWKVEEATNVDFQ